MNRKFFIAALLCHTLPLQASFIESTVGTAVVEDATATYYNPAALILLKKPQLVTLASSGNSTTQFRGQSSQITTGFMQSGNATTDVSYFLPSIYLGIPVFNKIKAGIAVISNDFNKDIERPSILRYAQSDSKIQAIDVVPAVGLALNKFLSFGLALNRSEAHFLLQPISGAPSLNIPDSQSRNETRSDAWGGDLGFLLKPGKKTFVGLNYRQAMTYRMHGKSVFNGPVPTISDSYRFKYWTPARTVLSISHFVNPKFGFIGTVQHIDWSIFKEVTVHDIATAIGIVPTARVPYNFQNTWHLTMGGIYRASSKWVIRGAGSYIQSPSNGRFQIDNGDTVTLGASMAYAILKSVVVDCSYAHAFIRKQDINIVTAQNTINGINTGAVNAVALKLTFNI